jgi:hypothetical protein
MSNTFAIGDVCRIVMLMVAEHDCPHELVDRNCVVAQLVISGKNFCSIDVSASDECIQKIECLSYVAAAEVVDEFVQFTALFE